MNEGNGPPTLAAGIQETHNVDLSLALMLIALVAFRLRWRSRHNQR